MDLNKDKKQEREAYMGFTLAKDIAVKVAEMALSMGESNEARVVSGTDGQVLVRYGSTSYLERKDDREILMIPVKLMTVINGNTIEQTFYLCTK